MRSESEVLDLLRRLTLAAGAPGDEGEVRSIVRQQLEGAGELSTDRIGSLLCEKRGSAESPRVVLDGHLDEVAFMVQSIDSEGRLKILPLGGWWSHVLLSQRVDVLSEKGKIPGVIGSKPPHFLSKSERNRVLDIGDLFVDIGAASRQQAEELGIRIGDTIVPHSEFVEFAAPGVLSSKAFDNRVGIGILCETMLALGDTAHASTVIGVSAVQEEVGCRGATTASELARPDLALVLEGTPADDLPGFKERQAILGKGPQIRLYDPTAISNRKLVRFVEKVASDVGIDIQLAVRRSGGTDARSIQRWNRGVPTVVIGVPARYIHSHVSLIRAEDYLASCQLVLELVRRIDQDVVDSVLTFD